MTAPLVTAVPLHPAAAMAEEQVAAGNPNNLLFTSQFADHKNYQTN